MCLSAVYLDSRDDANLVLRDVSVLARAGDGVELRTLFGDSKTVESCRVGEVNLMENYVVLQSSEEKA